MINIFLLIIRQSYVPTNTTSDILTFLEFPGIFLNDDWVIEMVF